MPIYTRKLRSVFVALSLCGAVASWRAAAAVDLEAAVETAGRDVQSARADLNAAFERFRMEKQQLVDDVEAARSKTQVLAEKGEQAATDLDALAEEMDNAQNELEHLRQIEEHIRNIVLEYRQAFETRLSPVDAERLTPPLEDIDRRLQNDAPTVSPEVLGQLIALSADHVTQGIAGRRTGGAAVDMDGVRHDGQFVRIGPITYFRGDDGRLAGIAVQQVGSALPTVFQKLDPEQMAAIDALFETGSASPPVDITMGSAIQLQQTRETLVEHLRKGGVTMIPLLGLAAVCILIVLFKLGAIVTLATSRSQETVLRIVAALRAGDVEQALSLSKRLRRPLGPVIREGIEHRDASKEHLEEILYEQILNQVPRLERFLSPLAVCASAAPLLGLLGTVTGMIHTFRLITVFGTGDARLLSSGISEALITTEVGLVVAIPALLFHAYLSRRIRRAVALAQEMAVSFVNGLKLKGEWAE
jgi:biopolymer transport protein ExbB